MINQSVFRRQLRLPKPSTETFRLWDPRQTGKTTLLKASYPSAAPKFFFADVGIVNQLAKRGELRPGSELYGKAFENWVFHELSAHNAYTESFASLSYWRIASGIEVDFIVNDMQVAIEAKATSKATADHIKGLAPLRRIIRE